MGREQPLFKKNPEAETQTLRLKEEDQRWEELNRDPEASGVHRIEDTDGLQLNANHILDTEDIELEPTKLIEPITLLRSLIRAQLEKKSGEERENLSKLMKAFERVESKLLVGKTLSEQDNLLMGRLEKILDSLIEEKFRAMRKAGSGHESHASLSARNKQAIELSQLEDARLAFRRRRPSILTEKQEREKMEAETGRMENPEAK